MTEIRQGLATLHALNLDFGPAGDVIQATANLWIGDLWASCKRDWHESDVGGIREAFRALRSTCRRWPQQADFWQVLPTRQISDATALPARLFTNEERAANIGKLAKIGQELLGIKPD